MADGRMVSLHWGGSTNPDGGLKKSKVAPAEAAAKNKVKRTERAATKATVRECWLIETQGGVGWAQTVAGQSVLRSVAAGAGRARAGRVTGGRGVRTA